jgi:VanZ family protein
LTLGPAPAWLLARRWCFAACALALFTATHWPKLRIEGTGRPDIWIHFFAFSVWTGSLLAAAFFGPVLSRRNIALSVLVAVLYAAFDEVTQAIPILHRTAAFDDWLADLGGIFIAATAAMILAAVLHKPKPDSQVPSPPS